MRLGWNGPDLRNDWHVFFFVFVFKGDKDQSASLSYFSLDRIYTFFMKCANNF
jgi:hypothetical protein